MRNRLSMSAGSLAFHWFLAIFPAMIAVIGSLTILHLSPTFIAHLQHAIHASLPAGVSKVFDTAILAAVRRSSASIGAVIIGVLVALWSASSGMAALEQALDVAYEVQTDRGFLSRRVRAVPLMVVTLVLGGASSALMVFGAPLGAGIEGHVPVHGVAFTVVWTVARWALAALATMLLFSIYYTIGPYRERTHWRFLSEGAIVATVIYLAASLGLSFYVTTFGSYGRTYGSFAGVAILIFWLYLTGVAVLVGGEINADIERTPIGRAAPQR